MLSVFVRSAGSIGILRLRIRIQGRIPKVRFAGHALDDDLDRDILDLQILPEQIRVGYRYGSQILAIDGRARRPHFFRCAAFPPPTARSPGVPWSFRSCSVR